MREVLMRVSRSGAIKSLITKAPLTSAVVDRYVAGETVDEVLGVTGDLVGAKLAVTIDHLGEDTTKISQASSATDAYLDLLGRLAEAELADQAEVSVKLSAVGQLLGADGEKIATENAQLICQAASDAGTTVTIDMEDHTLTDSTLSVVRELRRDYPWVGAVLQAYLFRTEGDCADLAYEGSRIRLCKGAYAEPESVAYTEPAEIDKSYVRCTKILMAGQGYPMLATHDPRLVEIGVALAERQQRDLSSFELQMLYGIRPAEQHRLATLGHTMRVYVPYGTDWYGYLVRRLAEKPGNVRFFAHSLVSRH
ncbi:MAG: proline dehydrogenase family protein [Microlunatus sp.]|nr:proline dehydrogenase family protein [Microlunatus sp.]MDN5771106.1 proline dehydrogenase family protein [Microlunatus sp.]